MRIFLQLTTLFSSVCALVCASTFTFASSTPWQSADHIKVRLVSNLQTLAPDTTFYVGLELVPDEHWHVYWQNPGDSGMPISIAWQLPEGVSEEKLIWPIPEKIPFGHLTNYGYEGRVIVPVRMRSNDQVGTNNKLKAKANWLVCKDTCIPGSADLELTLEKNEAGQQSKYADSLQYFIQQEAQPLDLMSGNITAQNASLSMQLFADKPVFNAASKIEFFPINESLFKAGANADIHWKNNFLSLSQEKSESYYKLPETISGLLVIDDKQAWEFSFNTQP